jgi:hypothetical protein
MRSSLLPLLLAVGLLSCLRSPYPSPVPVEDDTSIRFPPFFEREAIEVGASGMPYELDGVTLRALAIAANDFLPPGGKNRPCEYRQEAQRYRILRQERIIFIYILPDYEYCGDPMPLDGGVRYAISTDGRILRRVFDGQPEDTSEPLNFDAGGWGPPARPGISPEFDARWNRPDAGAEPIDGGAGPSPAPPPLPTPARDGGSPSAP